jgi:hypothetical protein
MVKRLLLFQDDMPSVFERARERQFVGAFKRQGEGRAASNNARTIHVENQHCVWHWLDRHWEITIETSGFTRSGNVSPGSSRLRNPYLDLEFIGSTRRFRCSNPSAV